MTEAEWLECEDPEALLNHFQNWMPGRKALLLACGCCRRKWLEIGDTSERLKVAVAERFADGAVSEEEFFRAFRDGRATPTNHPVTTRLREAVACVSGLGRTGSPARVAELLRALAEATGYDDTAGMNLRHPPRSVHFRRGRAREFVAQSALVRDVFGDHPFRPAVFSPAWRTDTAVALAQQMYDAREFSAMPILADALQDAGCDNEEVLGHCRGAGPHVRGCWVVDLVLGKE